MSAKQTQEWAIGDLFTVELADGSYAIGQVLDLPMTNVVSVALFDRRVEMAVPLERITLTENSVISVASVIPAHLDRYSWKVFASAPLVLAHDQFPNEETRQRGWVGFKTYTGAILVAFLNAFYGLAPWDQFHDPKFLDGLLISPAKKPSRIIFK